MALRGGLWLPRFPTSDHDPQRFLVKTPSRSWLSSASSPDAQHLNAGHSASCREAMPTAFVLVGGKDSGTTRNQGVCDHARDVISGAVVRGKAMRSIVSGGNSLCSPNFLLGLRSKYCLRVNSLQIQLLGTATHWWLSEHFPTEMETSLHSAGGCQEKLPLRRLVTRHRLFITP